MLNKVFKDADYLSVPVPTGTLAGSPVRVGGLNVITVTDEGSVSTTISLGAGVSIIQPTGAQTGNKAGWASATLKGSANLEVTGVTAFGTPVYIKTSDNSLQVTAAAGTKHYGYALGIKTAPKAPVHVKVINGSAVADAA